jgi:hypothetical protein
MQDPKQDNLKDWQKWFKLLFDEFEKESDRAAVILTSAMIEDSLEDLIKAKLAPSSSSDDPLFDGSNAPVGSLSAKIEIALRLGLVSDQFARDLHLIRKIRNDFAHNISGCTFEDSATRSRVEELLRSWRNLQIGLPRSDLAAGTRNDFLYVTAWMLVSIRTDLPNIQTFPKAAPEFGYSAEDMRRTVRSTPQLANEGTAPQLPVAKSEGTSEATNDA